MRDKIVVAKILHTAEGNAVLQEGTFHRGNTLLTDDNQIAVFDGRHVSHETVNVWVDRTAHALIGGDKNNEGLLGDFSAVLAGFLGGRGGVQFVVNNEFVQCAEEILN